MGASLLLVSLYLSDSSWVRVVLFENRRITSLTLEYGDTWRVEARGDSLLVNGRLKDELVVWGARGKRITLPDGTKRTYPGKLIVRTKRGKLQILNVVSVEDYLASVVAAEIGQAPLEALKAQAVLSRTLLFKVLLEKERGVISDHEAFQVYRGLGPVFPEALEAVRATRNLVLAYKGRLAQVYFHAACGGVLASASQVWGAQHPPYIRTGIDSVCLGDTAQRWEKRLRWRGPKVRLLSWGRRAAARVGKKKLTGVQLRKRFGLKSAFITKIIQEGDTLIIRGRGHGHGVGFCQTGAKLRALRGDSFCEILGFYFPGATITTIKKVLNKKEGRRGAR